MTAIEKSEWKCASWKKEKDFTEEVNLALNALTDKVYGRIEDIDRDTNPLFELEKMTRLNGDVENCKRVAVRIMTMYLQSNNLEQLLDIAQLLVHRRAQSALVQSAVIRELMNSLPSFSSTLDENVLIKCLVRIQDLTEGKIHVELEYGKVSVQLARLHEKMGSVAQAVHVLQHLQVESMTHMPKAEKLDVLVYHIALCIAIKDYTKAAIMSRKIGTKAIAAPEFRDLRVKYLELMSQYYAHFRNYYHLAICAWELYECTGRQPNSKHLQDAINYLMACSPKSSEELIEEGECTAFSPLNVNGMDKATWLQKLAKLPEVKKFPVELSMIIIFTNVSWAPSVSISKHHKYLTDSGYEHVLKELDSRLIEHNIITLSKFYSQIYIHRLAEFVSATNTVVENTIMHLVTLNLTSAKINRVEGIVYFGKRVKFDDELEIWSQGISNVMSKINNTCHRIAKERMIHGH